MPRFCGKELLNIPGLIFCWPPARATLVIRNVRQVPVLPYADRPQHKTNDSTRDGSMVADTRAGWHYVVGEFRIGAKDEYTAARATITFATTTGIAPMKNPYVTHISAPMACTMRSIFG